MNELLERIQKERNNDVPNIIPIPNPNPNKLELVDLNKFDTNEDVKVINSAYFNFDKYKRNNNDLRLITCFNFAKQ